MGSVLSLESYLQDYPWPKSVLAQADGEPLEFLWSFKLKHPVEKVWPFVADTSRFNRALGLTTRSEREVAGRAWITDSIMGFVQEWEELPWEWVVNQDIRITRIYSEGIARHFRGGIRLRADLDPSGTTTILTFYFGWLPRNWICRQILKIKFSNLHQRFKTLVAEIDQHLSRQTGGFEKQIFFEKRKKLEFDEHGRDAVAKLRSAFKGGGIPPEISDPIIQLLTDGDELDLQKIRVLPLARKWNADEKSLIKAFLHATEQGCLRLSWDVICPHCRGVRKEVSALKQIGANEQCDVCQISFSTATTDAIEVTFRVHPRLRKIPNILYCSAEPDKKPHIQLQSLIPAKSGAHYRLTLGSGVYRARVVGRNFGLIFETDATSTTKALTFDSSFREATPSGDRVHYANELAIDFNNRDDEPKTFILEQFLWHNDALKPMQVLSIPEFSHIFSLEHLQNETILDLGVRVVLFTDMVASTKFYRQNGDGRAYLHVKKHFELIFARVEQFNGYVVKTVGDSVMATFDRGEDALKAAVFIQQAFEAGQATLPIRLRITIHQGPTMAVNLKHGIDFFGGTVNYAAKMQSLAGAADIALSEAVYQGTGQLLKQVTEELGYSCRTQKFSLHEGMDDSIQILTCLIR